MLTDVRTASPRTVDGNTVTVTQRVTVDQYVTDTETSYNSVPVTLTNVIVHTETLQTFAVSSWRKETTSICSSQLVYYPIITPSTGHPHRRRRTSVGADH